MRVSAIVFAVKSCGLCDFFAQERCFKITKSQTRACFQLSCRCVLPWINVRPRTVADFRSGFDLVEFSNHTGSQFYLRRLNPVLKSPTLQGLVSNQSKKWIGIWNLLPYGVSRQSQNIESGSEICYRTGSRNFYLPRWIEFLYSSGFSIGDSNCWFEIPYMSCTVADFRSWFKLLRWTWDHVR